MFPLIIVFIIILIYVVPQVYTFSKNPNLPTIFLTGSMHGDEPAGSEYLQGLIRELKQNNPYNYNIIIMPTVNKIGKLLNTRNLITDINRSFKSWHPITEMIKSYDVDVTVDLHEGWGYLIDDNGSVGSSVYNSLDRNNAKYLVDIVNKLPETKPFGIIEPDDVIEGTYSQYRRDNNRNHYLIETTGKNNAQPMKTRLSQLDVIVKSILTK